MKADAEPTTEFRDLELHHTCPCGESLHLYDDEILSSTHVEWTYGCQNGHRWKRVSMIGFSTKWERLEGVGA